MPAILIGIAAVLWGPTVAQRLPWRALTLTTWATSCAWAFSLAMIDGWQRGFAGRLTARHEYLRQVPTVTDIPEALSSFSRRILDYQPDSWITHVSGHPPGALLTFVWLDRIGLGGGAWAGPAVPAGRIQRGRRDHRRGAGGHRRSDRTAGRTVRGRGADGHLGRRLGRRLLRGRGRMGHRPAGTGRATQKVRVPLLVAGGAGLLLGWAIFLNYGLALIAFLALAVLITAVDWHAALRTSGSRRPDRRGSSSAVFFAARLLVVRRLYPCAGTLLAGDRQRSAVPVLVVGQLRVGGVRDRARQRGRHRPGIRHRRHPQTPRPAPAGTRRAAGDRVRRPEHAEQGRNRTHLAAVHDLAHRGAGPAPPQSHRLWLALNVIGALALNSFILTNW